MAPPHPNMGLSLARPPGWSLSPWPGPSPSRAAPGQAGNGFLCSFVRPQAQSQVPPLEKKKSLFQLLWEACWKTPGFPGPGGIVPPPAGPSLHKAALWGASGAASVCKGRGRPPRISWPVIYEVRPPGLPPAPPALSRGHRTLRGSRIQPLPHCVRALLCLCLLAADSARA